MANDEPSNQGEIREDIPLRPSDSSSFSNKFGGVKLIIISFTILSIAVTIALATQIHYGDYEVVPHGSVATDSQECSRIGTDILKIGGNAVDAAIAAAFCLSVINPHTAGLDAIGSAMIYNYRKSRLTNQNPIVVDFIGDDRSNIPQLVKGLAFLHTRFGSIQWEKLVLPSAELARTGFNVPDSLVMATQRIDKSNLFGPIQPGNSLKLPVLATFLYAIANSSVSSFIPEAKKSGISTSEAINFDIGNSTIYMPYKKVTSKLVNYLNYSSIQSGNSYHDIVRTANNLKMTFQSYIQSSSSSIAVIDKDENYISLILGLYTILGSKMFANGGFILNDLPNKIKNTNDFVPIIITPQDTCGQRIVLSCSDITGTAQVIENILSIKRTTDQLVTALENPRLQILNGSNLAYEKSHQPVFNEHLLDTLRLLGPLLIVPEPYSTCNAIQQVGDNLISHSDSRGGGIASRF